jgi:hypothetical protein
VVGCETALRGLADTQQPGCRGCRSEPDTWDVDLLAEPCTRPREDHVGNARNPARLGEGGAEMRLSRHALAVGGRPRSCWPEGRLRSRPLLPLRLARAE